MKRAKTVRVEPANRERSRTSRSNTILLLSTDCQLRDRIGEALAGSEQIMLLAPDAATNPLAGPPHQSLVVLDCRALERAGAAQALVRLQETPLASLRCVALVGGEPARVLEVIGREAARDLLVVLSDHEDVGTTLRAMLNDVDGSVGTAIALEGLRPDSPPVAFAIAAVVLGSACRVHSVGRVAARLRSNRSTIRTQLDAEGSPAPKQMIRVARAAYAVVLARRTHLTIGQIAERIRVSAGRYVQELLESEFGTTADAIRAQPPEIDVSPVIGRMLAEWSRRNTTWPRPRTAHPAATIRPPA